MATWVQLTLADKEGDAPAGTVIFLNLDQAGLIYPRENGTGSDIWFSPDMREQTNKAEWCGHTFVQESPDEIMSLARKTT